jgi:hypothetical protein
VPGGGVRIAVGPDGSPWLVNTEGRIFRRQGGRWVERPGRARDIAVAANGTPWIVGLEAVTGGHALYRWAGNDWGRVEGGGVAIAAR